MFVCLYLDAYLGQHVQNRYSEPTWPGGRRRSAGKRKEGRAAGSSPSFGSPFSEKKCDLWALSRDFILFALHNKINETLKWLTSLGHLNAEIILVVTVYTAVRYKLPLLSQPSTFGTTYVRPDVT